MGPAKKDDLISVAEAAALLPSTSPLTVRRWARAGKVPFIELPGGRVWFKREDILALLEPVVTDGQGAV